MERVVTPITVEMITGTKKETIQVGQTVVERPKVAAKSIRVLTLQSSLWRWRP
jgi:hypothetical protein